MAFGKFSLFWLVVVIGLMSVSKSTGIRHERSYSEEEEEGNDRFIFKKESSWKRIDAEAGQIRVFPIFKGSSSRTASPLHNYELNSIQMDPNSLLVPQYINADGYIYGYQGKGRIGWIHNQKLIEQDLETGQIYYLPKGSPFYVINTDKNQRLRIITFLHNDKRIHAEQRHESFYVAGGQNPQTVFSGFRRETLAAAFGVDSREVEQVLSKQERGAIISLGQEQETRGIVSMRSIVSMGKEQMDDELHSWPWSSSKKHKGSVEEEKPFNLQKKKPEFSNDNGQYIRADRKSFGPLKRQDLAIVLTKIKPGRMTAPYYCTSANAVSFVLSGRGRVEIVLPEFTDRRQRDGEGEEVERERGSESETEMESDRRVEDELNAGDVFVVPAGYPSVQIADPEEQFEILTFLINNEHNNINFLTGENSVLREIKDEVLAASLDAKEETLKKVIEAQKDERFLRGPQEPQVLSSIV